MSAQISDRSLHLVICKYLLCSQGFFLNNTNMILGNFDRRLTKNQVKHTAGRLSYTITVTNMYPKLLFGDKISMNQENRN